MKEIIITFLSLMFFVTIILSFLVWVETYKEKQPCDFFREISIKNVPARCVNQFNNK